MKEPTAEQVAEARADAIKRFGSDAVLWVELDASIEQVVLVAPVDFAAYCSHVDDQVRDLDTSHLSLLIDRRLWPPLPELLELTSKFGAFAQKCCVPLYEEAGQIPAAAVTVPLTKANTPSGANFDELVAAHPGGSLWVTKFGARSFVLKAPLTDVYLAAKSARAAATADCKDVLRCLSTVVREAVVWSPEPLAELLERKPAVFGDLRDAFFATGGAGARVRTKRV